MKEWVSDALKFSGMNQAELSRALATNFKWPDNRSVLNKIVTGERELKANEMFDISKATGFPIPGAMQKEVKINDRQLVPAAVVGNVEAGTFREVDDFDQSEPEIVMVPPDEKYPRARLLVFNVSGNSMNDLKPRPILPADRIVCVSYEDIEHEVVLRDGMVAVVQRTRDGGHYREWSVKQIEIYEDRTEFHPRSTNASYKPIVIDKNFSADDGVTVEVIALVRRVMNEMPGF